MKKLLILVCVITNILTGCTLPWDKGKDEFVLTEMSMHGTVLSIRPVEVNVTNEVDGNNISEVIQYNAIEFSNSDGGIFNIYFNKEVDISELHPETGINTTTYTVENENYLIADSFEITYQPTKYITGITAEELISRPTNHDKQMSHIDYIMIGDLDYKSDGMFEHIQAKSQTVLNDPPKMVHRSTELR